MVEDDVLNLVLHYRLLIIMTYNDLQEFVALLIIVTLLVLNFCLATPNHDIKDVNQRLALFWLALRVNSNGNEVLNFN